MNSLPCFSLKPVATATAGETAASATAEAAASAAEATTTAASAADEESASAAGDLVLGRLSLGSR